MADNNASLAMAVLALGSKGGGSEPEAYLKNASVSDNTLTLVNKDDTTVEFTPQGGGSEVSGTNDGTNWTSITIDDDTYAIPSGGGSSEGAVRYDEAQTLTDAQKNQAKANQGLPHKEYSYAQKFNDTISIVQGTADATMTTAISNIANKVQFEVTSAGVTKSVESVPYLEGEWYRVDFNQLGVTQLRIDETSLKSIRITGDDGSYNIKISEVVESVVDKLGAEYINSNVLDTLKEYTYSSDRKNIYLNTKNADALANFSKNALKGDGSLVLIDAQAFQQDYAQNVISGDNSIVAWSAYSPTSSRAIYSEASNSILAVFTNAYGGYEPVRFASCANVVGAIYGAANHCAYINPGRTALVCGYSDIASTDYEQAPFQVQGRATLTNGYCVQTGSNYQHAEGKFNIKDSADTYAYIIGNGTAHDARSNAFTVDWQGNGVFAGTVSSSGSDYAEFFEWADGNPDEEDRIAYIVALDNGKIRLANENDDILGIVSGTTSMTGDDAEWTWHGKFLQDKYGRYIYEDYDVVHEEGTEHEWVEHVHTRKINPDYDPERPYVPRSERPEWSEIGLLGKLYVRDDGTAEVNGYVKADNGIATNSDEKTNMRVLERIDANTIRVLLK